jgi:hyperosmotically inducible protein
MKTSLRTTAAFLALAGSLALVQVGCTATPTRESTGEYIDDAALTAKVKSEFVKDPAVKAIDVKVETFKGVVQLSGFVDTQDQKSRAAQLAANVPGVRDVKNNINVKAAAAR